MPLDPQLWLELECHGVREAHLRMLLKLLQVQRNGAWFWHYAHGQVTQCEARLLFPPRESEVEHISAELFGGDGMVR